MSDATRARDSWRRLLDDARVVALARAAGDVPLHLVGGVVRDAALGRAVDDLDVVVAAAGPALADRLAASLGARVVPLGGERFGALRVVAGERHVDIWDLRGGPLDVDLWRRDLTVNAIAVAVPDGTIVDPTGGEADLSRRRLRATRPEVFAEDPVRVLRLARLATTLPGFDVDPATIAAARAVTPALAAMPFERVRAELDLLFSQDLLAAAAGRCEELGLPALFFGKGAALAAGASSTLPHARELDRWRELRRREGEDLFAASAEARTSPLPLHWSLLTEHFSSSHEQSAARVRDLVRSGLMTRACGDLALALLAPDWRAPADAVGRRRWLHSAGASWVEAVALRAALAESEDEREKWRRFESELLSWSASERRAIVSPPPLLSGSEVQDLLGAGPGPVVGAALARVREAQVEGGVRTREEAEALLREFRGFA